MNGQLLWGLAAAPLLAAILVGAGWRDSVRRAISFSLLAVGASLALIVAVMANASEGVVECRATVEAWRVGSFGAAPTVTLSLGKEWSFAPLLLFGFTFASLLSTSVGRHAMVQWQCGTVLAVVLLPSPTQGMLAVSASTVAAAALASSNGTAIGLRWIVADAVVWTSLLGLMGGSAWPIYFAVAVRASLFPFHSGLPHAVRQSHDLGLNFIPLPAVAWAFRWLDPVPLTAGWQVWVWAAAVVPALFSLGERNQTVALGYRLAAVVAWPILLPTSPSVAIAVMAFGIAAACLNTSSLWRSASAAASMIIPIVVAFRETDGLSSFPLIAGCMVVSASAFLVQWRANERSGEESLPRLVSEFASAWIVLAALASLTVGAS